MCVPDVKICLPPHNITVKNHKAAASTMFNQTRKMKGESFLHVIRGRSQVTRVILYNKTYIHVTQGCVLYNNCGVLNHYIPVLLHVAL